MSRIKNIIYKKYLSVINIFFQVKKSFKLCGNSPKIIKMIGKNVVWFKINIQDEILSFYKYWDDNILNWFKSTEVNISICMSVHETVITS